MWDLVQLQLPCLTGNLPQPAPHVAFYVAGNSPDTTTFASKANVRDKLEKMP